MKPEVRAMKRRLIQWLLATCALALAGCWNYPRAPVAAPATMEQKYFNQLWYYAADELHCRPKNLTYESFGQGRHLFKGCGAEIEMISLGQGWNTFVRPAAANRFTKEFDCARAATTEERIDDDTRVVAGCDHRAIYVYACLTAGCTWVANTRVDAK
jgi:hypothetical protein